jgi:MFS family permease
MYLSTRSLAAAGRREASDGETEAPPRPDVERNVWYLGLTSMFTDVSSEMIVAVLPLYLTLFLGFGPLQFGIFDGAFQGLTALVAIAAAVGADRGRRHKLTAGTGYVISAVSTAGLLLFRGAWLGTVGMLFFTRLGKGVRTAPRDALISLSVAPARLGRAFGLHRSFDTVGAVAGPILAGVLLGRDATGYGTVFAVGFFVAVIGVAVFWLFVEGIAPTEAEAAAVARPRVRRRRLSTAVPALRRKVEAALRERRFRLVLVAAATLALVRPGDGLLYLPFQKVVSPAQFPLLYSGASVLFLIAAAPLGRLADRIGKLRVYVIGELAVAGALAVLATGARSTGALILVLALVGISYAATDGVLMALASAALPDRWRTTGLAVVATVIALGRFAASTGFGAVWERFGETTAARVYLAGTLVAVMIGVVLLRRDDDRPTNDGARADLPLPQLEAA